MIAKKKYFELLAEFSKIRKEKARLKQTGQLTAGGISRLIRKLQRLLEAVDGNKAQ